MAATQNAQTPGSIAYVTAPATSGPLQVNAPASSPNQLFKVKITGGLQIACAVLSVIFGVFAILIATCAIGDVVTCQDNYGDFYFPVDVGWPIWGGVFFYGVAGILGVCSGNRNKCVIVACMVMSIISAAIAFGQLIMESLCATIRSSLQAMHSLSAVVAFVEMVVAIVSAAYCCHDVCFQPWSPAPQQVIVQYQPTAQGQVFQQPPPGPFQSNNQGQVVHQQPAGPFHPNVQGVYPPPTAPLQQGQMLHQPPNVQPGNQPPPYQEVEGHPYQKLVES